MSLAKAIAHGKEHRKSYEERGKPGRHDVSCRPHGAGHSRPCPRCERARLMHAYKERQAVRLELEDLNADH